MYTVTRRESQTGATGQTADRTLTDAPMGKILRYKCKFLKASVNRNPETLTLAAH